MALHCDEYTRGKCDCRDRCSKVRSPSWSLAGRIGIGREGGEGGADVQAPGNRMCRGTERTRECWSLGQGGPGCGRQSGAQSL